MVDRLSPLVGWRVWAIDAHQHLRSLYCSDGPWKGYVPLQAGCTELGYDPDMEEGGAPHEECHCGIYALPKKEWALKIARIYLEQEGNRNATLVIGQVALWGKVIEHERGWRAQFAYPVALELSESGSGLEGVLSRRYGVPVHTPTHLINKPLIDQIRHPSPALMILTLTVSALFILFVTWVGSYTAEDYARDVQALNQADRSSLFAAVELSKPQTPCLKAAQVRINPRSLTSPCLVYAGSNPESRWYKLQDGSTLVITHYASAMPAPGELAPIDVVVSDGITWRIYRSSETRLAALADLATGSVRVDFSSVPGISVGTLLLSRIYSDPTP